MYFCFISPLGFGLIDTTDSSSNDKIKWKFFTGSVENIAQSYYNILNAQDYSEILSLLPENGIIQTHQRSLFNYLSSKYQDSDNVHVKISVLEFDRLNKIYFQLNIDEKNKIDEISKVVATLTVQNQKDTKDVYIAQAIASLDDLTKTINLVSNRLREWYGIHFPELGEYITDTAQLFRLIREIGNRSTNLETELSVSEKKGKRLLEMAKNSLGTSIGYEELNPILDLAKLGSELSNTKKEIEAYIENAVFIIMPNVTKLIGPLVSARMLAQAGSLKNLSKMPSSTVQLLGAERALFRHLKTGEKPPKHGFLFQSAYVHQAPFHQRGKIARVIAGKVSIASRLDYFLGEEYPNIVDDLNKRLAYITKTYANPPTRKKKSSSSSSRRKFEGKSRDSGRRTSQGKRDDRSRSKDRKSRPKSSDRDYSKGQGSRSSGEKSGSSNDWKSTSKFASREKTEKVNKVRSSLPDPNRPPRMGETSSNRRSPRKGDKKRPRKNVKKRR